MKSKAEIACAYANCLRNRAEFLIAEERNTWMEVVPTLNFSGCCREAIKMYERAFGGKTICMITYREANDPTYIPLLDESQKDCIYHAELQLNNIRIIMSDNLDIEFGTCFSNFITIVYDTKEQVERAYEIMREGSKTIYQMEATQYSSCRAAFIDKFGIRWGILTEQAQR